MWHEDIELTPEGGRYYRAISFHIIVNIILIIIFIPLFVFVFLIPSKYRSGCSTVVDTWSEKISYKRDFYKYWIYLNCNPKVWHILKDPDFDGN